VEERDNPPVREDDREYESPQIQDLVRTEGASVTAAMASTLPRAAPRKL